MWRLLGKHQQLNKCPFPPRKGARSRGRTRRGSRKGLGEKRVPGEPRGHFRYTEEVEDPEGRPEGGLSEGGGPSPWAQSTPQLPRPEPGQGRTVPGLAQPGGRKGGLPGPCLLCRGRGGGVGGQSGPTRSLSPSLQLSLSPHLTRCVSASLVLPSYCLSHLGVCGPSRSMPLSLWVSPPSLRQSFGLFLAVSGREDPSPQLQPLPGSHPPPAHLASGQGH